MLLTGLERISVRPRGGVKGVELVSAPDFTPDGTSTGAKLVFREDGATYSEELVGDPSVGFVRHTLRMELPAGEATRRAVDELLTRSSQGLVARVELASGERLVVGYCPRFGTGYPLRPTAITYGSGSAPADFPSVTLTLECIDA